MFTSVFGSASEKLGRLKKDQKNTKLLKFENYGELGKNGKNAKFQLRGEWTLEIFAVLDFFFKFSCFSMGTHAFLRIIFFSFLGAPTHLYNWLCPSVCRSACWLVGNAFVRRSTRRTLLACLAWFSFFLAFLIYKMLRTSHFCYTFSFLKFCPKNHGVLTKTGFHFYRCCTFIFVVAWQRARQSSQNWTVDA